VVQILKWWCGSCTILLVVRILNSFIDGADLEQFHMWCGSWTVLLVVRILNQTKLDLFQNLSLSYTQPQQ
jgi:hypothetical protein